MKKAYTINEFCKAHDISRSLFYKLQANGKGPEIFTLGRRVLISAYAAEKWLKEIEQGKTCDLK